MFEDQVHKYLMKPFRKYDVDNSGEIGLKEFIDAWADLELKGDPEEVKETFAGVDANGSGYISSDEFLKGMKGARMEELSNRVLILALEDEYGSIENFIQQQKGDYGNYKNTVQRRRLLKKKYEENLANQTKRLIAVLSELVT